MSAFTYPAKFTTGSDGRVLVEFADLPRVSTDGKDDREAMEEAMDALGSDLSIRLSRREEIPSDLMAACWSSLPIYHASRPTVKTIARQWKRPWMPWDPIFRSACRAGKRFRCPHLPSAVSDWCPCRFGWRRNWRSIWRCAMAKSTTPNWPAALASTSEWSAACSILRTLPKQ